MADQPNSPQETSPLPDSISDNIDSVESVVECLPVASSEPKSSELPSAGSSFNSELQSSTPPPVESSPSYAAGPSGRMTIPKKPEQSPLPACTIAPVLPLNSDLHLPGSSTSAFRPFVTQTSLPSTREISSSAQNQSSTAQTQLTSTPVSRRAERMTLPSSTNFSSLVRKSPTPSPNRQVLLGETSSNNNDDNEDGRTTASAPPCTPAPEPYQQPQSPFRNTRQIKKIDLLAMSRSRQSDRAENARRDGRLAPSPRKKDEVLRNSGFTFPACRGPGTQSSLRLSMQNSNSLSVNDTGVSPERVVNSSAASPNVDVVSVDDQADPSKCMFSIQFHDFAPAEQMMKCSLCGFVTNNQRFYRRHRRLHSRQYQPNLIHCSLCDYTTTQIRKMREHTITNHHMSHPHSFTNFSQNFNHPSSMPESTHRLPLQGQMFIGNGSIFHPVTNRPLNVPVGAATATAISDAPTMGLPTYIPAPQDHHIQVNTQSDLQHPPRGSAMLGNYAPTNEQQVASYMRSVISNLMSPPRTDPNNSVTSSGLYLQAARNFPQESHTAMPSNSNVPGLEGNYSYRRFWNSNNNSSTMSSSQNISGASFIKVKTEPRPAPLSTVPRAVHDMPSSTQKDRPTRSPRRQSDTLDSESGMDMSSDDHASSPQPDMVNSRGDARISTETNQTDNTTQADGSTVGSQCSGPFIKIEFPPHREPCSFTRSSCTRSDRGIQCEIISMSGMSHRHGGRTQSETVSSAGGAAHVDTRCYFCGVTFDDEVLYSIHIGCHSHTDPFMCNVCGKQCYNKYGFYSHIMRGHQSRPST